MFTGIIEETGFVEEIVPSAKSIRMIVRANLTLKGAKIGDSLAVNGCCLTMVKLSRQGKNRRVEFDLLRETWDLTNFQFVQAGSLLNLERSLAVNGRVHGHFVTGHVDGLGTIKTFEQRGADWFLEIVPPKALLRYIVHKGAIAIDGISLTVAAVSSKSFSIWIIPHTRAVTALQQRKAGDKVNLEADLLAKYAEKALGSRV